jgi:hypothetical protein
VDNHELSVSGNVNVGFNAKIASVAGGNECRISIFTLNSAYAAVSYHLWFGVLKKDSIHKSSFVFFN